MRIPAPLFHVEKGTSTESSQIPGALVTVVYTNPPLLYSKKKGMLAKEIGLRAMFLD